MKQLWYLSFVDEGGFKGACVVAGVDLSDALRTAWKLGINPGGAVMAIPVPEDKENLLPLNRLMSRKELECYGPVVRRGDMENPPQEIGRN